MKKLFTVLVTGLVIALLSTIAMAGQTVTFEAIKDMDAGTLSFEPEIKFVRDQGSLWFGYKSTWIEGSDRADVITLGLSRTPFTLEYVKPVDDVDGTLEFKLALGKLQLKYKRTLDSDAQGKITAKLTLGF